MLPQLPVIQLEFATATLIYPYTYILNMLQITPASDWILESLIPYSIDRTLFRYSNCEFLYSTILIPYSYCTPVLCAALHMFDSLFLVGFQIPIIFGVTHSCTLRHRSSQFRILWHCAKVRWKNTSYFFWIRTHDLTIGRYLPLFGPRSNIY